MPKSHIFIVEDEPDIADLLSYNLTREGYKVSVANRGDQAIGEIFRWQPSLILLDLMLPGLGGIEICRQLKAKPETAKIPIIMVTARGDETDIVVGLAMGADDYIVKPFGINVVLARIHAVLRRPDKVPAGAAETLKIHDITINPGRHEVICGKTAIELTVSEFRLFHFLARRPGWVFTREQIVDSIKGDDYIASDRTVDVQLVSLRKKLGKRGEYIETVRGVGYRFKP
jgi:two-component system phosphate regulon response regulator PhoB